LAPHTGGTFFLRQVVVGVDVPCRIRVDAINAITTQKPRVAVVVVATIEVIQQFSSIGVLD
jgi:hypothetical protein